MSSLVLGYVTARGMARYTDASVLYIIRLSLSYNTSPSSSFPKESKSLKSKSILWETASTA